MPPDAHADCVASNSSARDTANDNFTTFSSRAFARDFALAKRATRIGRVVVTHRGTPMHVLLEIEAYRRLVMPTRQSLLGLMDGIPGGDFDFEPPRR